LYHITWLNLRSVIVRQATEVLIQVVFLEISISYLAKAKSMASLTHIEDLNSWAALLFDGYQWLLYAGGYLASLVTGGRHGTDPHTLQALIASVVLIGSVTLMTQAFRMSARAR
jgi:hypothetical protein